MKDFYPKLQDHLLARLVHPTWSGDDMNFLMKNVLNLCKVVIPRGTGRSYGIRWRSEMRVTDETKGDGRTDGTYSAGVKDSASAYVLCPRLTEQLCLSIWKGVRSMERDLERFRERKEPERNAERRKRWDLNKLVYKLKLTTKACRNLYISEQ